MKQQLCIFGFIATMFSLTASVSREAELQKLEKERDKEWLQAVNKETEGQQYFLADWPEFADEMEEVQEHKAKVEELNNQIETIQIEPFKK